MHTLLLMTALAADPSGSPQFLRERFDNHALAQLYAPGVASLTRDEKLLAWHLTLAAHAGEPIAYDQLGWNLVAAKRLLECVYLFGREPGGTRSDFDARLSEYLKRFY